MQMNRNLKLNRLRATVFFALLFLCFLPLVKGYASETENHSATETVQKNDIVVNYSNEIITVKANGKRELYYGFGTVSKQPKAYQKIGPELLALYQDGLSSYAAFYIDLSAQAFKEGTVFYVKYSETDSATTRELEKREQLKAAYNGILPEDETGKAYADIYAVKINGQNLYRHFDEETGYLTFQYGGKDYTGLPNVEWRAGTVTNYRGLSELNLKMYQANGSSLYFRVNSGDAPISKEAKLKIRKPAKAPSVKLDGSKLTLNVKDTQEYRLEYADGSKTGWIPVEDNKKLLNLSELQGMKGDGIQSPFSQVNIQVRNAATLKNSPSYAANVYLDVPQLPVSGEKGVTATQADPADISKGIKVTNASEQDYLVALADREAWNCDGSVTELIKKINYNAKKGEVGYLTWKNVKAGSSATFSYSAFKTFEDSYVVLFRVAPVKENKSTQEREFRICSVVKPVGGILPEADLKSQAFLITDGNELTKVINFDKVEAYTLYTSVDGAEFTENSEWMLNISGNVGKTVRVKAYLVDDATAIQGDTVTYRYDFVADGELSEYANSWGYLQCKKNGWAIAYQRAYLATVTYAESFSVEGLSMETDEIMQVIKMMRLDHPEILQLGKSYTLRGDEMILPLGEKEEMDALLNECQETAENALAAIEEKYNGKPSKIEYIKEIHDFIVLEKQYKDSGMDQTMAGVLTDAYTPVCTSYALAFQYMCELAGIQSVVIHGDATNSEGDSESHVWNMVNLGETVDYARMLTESGKEIDPADWYEIDLTWDDPVGGQEDYVRYTYFNLTTDTMNSHSTGTKHVRSTGQAYDEYPVERCTGTTYNYDYLVANDYVAAQ